MDAADAPAAQGVMIALLPITTDWCKIEPPHMTLVYAGMTDELAEGTFNELAKDACSIALLTKTISLRVLGVGTMGDEEKVDVLKLQPTSELWAMRRTVEHWNASQHPFTPHATIGPVGSFIDPVPSMLAFNRIMAAWGEETLTFWLKGAGGY